MKNALTPEVLGGIRGKHWLKKKKKKEEFRGRGNGTLLERKEKE